MRLAAYTIALWWGAHVLLIAASVLEVFVYSLVVPGLPQEAYEAHAQLTAPWVSIVVGGPLLFAWGRILRARFEPPTSGRAAVAVVALYSLTDFAIVTAAGAWAPLLTAQWILSQSVKALGIWLGVRRPAPA